jgi:hypothetical protein
MSSFKPMVKMYTDEPSVILKLKKGGKVASKAMDKSDGFKSMAKSNAKSFENAEDGMAPKKPTHAARHKAMNPNLYAKGGKVAHKVMGGGMPMGAPQGMPAGAPMGGQPMQAMGQSALGQMTPAQRAARALMVRKALSGMKKGGSASADCAKLEKELKHHESMSMSKAHPMKKASGGAIDKAETRTTIKGNAKKFAKTKMHDGDRHDSAHGTGEVKEGKPGGYATGGAIPADTHESKNKAKTKMGGTLEGNEGDYENTQMHSAKKDKAHGTGGVSMGNAGGFKRGGKAMHKADGGAIDKYETRNTVEGGNWENRVANTSKPGKKNTKTGEVKESNAGGYKMGGKASKKAYATGGNVVDDGKPVAMPKKHLSQPVANSLQSGTFKKGGKVHHHSDGDSVEVDPTPSNSTDMRRKSDEANYSEQAVNKAIASSNRSGRKIGGKEAKAIHGLLKGRH